MVTASDSGMVSHIPDTPMSLGSVRMNATTKIRERREEK